MNQMAKIVQIKAIVIYQSLYNNTMLVAESLTSRLKNLKIKPNTLLYRKQHQKNFRGIGEEIRNAFGKEIEEKALMIYEIKLE